MDYKIALYDETKVSAQVKRLALCFNLAAEVNSKNENVVLKEGLDLFKATTGASQAPVLNGDEQAYMRVQFMKVAAKLNSGRSLGWATLEETVVGKANKLMEAAFSPGGYRAI